MSVYDLANKVTFPVAVRVHTYATTRCHVPLADELSTYQEGVKGPACGQARLLSRIGIIYDHNSDMVDEQERSLVGTLEYKHRRVKTRRM